MPKKIRRKRRRNDDIFGKAGEDLMKTVVFGTQAGVMIGLGSAAIDAFK